MRMDGLRVVVPVLKVELQVAEKVVAVTVVVVLPNQPNHTHA